MMDLTISASAAKAMTDNFTVLSRRQSRSLKTIKHSMLFDRESHIIILQ